MEQAIQVSPPPHVRISVYAAMSGWTEKAIRRKIEDGKWTEGKEYFRTPDNEIMISIQGVARWVEKGRT